MITRLLIAGAAIGALAAGGASAHVRHHHRRAHSAGYSYAEPAQPIPYAEVGHYLRSSPRERRAIEMAAVNTGGMANTSAYVAPPAAPASTISPGADTSVPAAEGANPTTGVTATPTPNNPSDQVPSTGPDVQGNPVAMPPPNPNPQPQ
ncbi:MAG: hypothetical protein ACREEB_03890 [Caulobacteraceae bacterium]